MTNIKNELISHKDLYVWTQINFAYHSNKIEGSKLSKDQIIQIFEENDLIMDLDDALEARNHFRLFDYMLKTVDEPLSKEMMIQMNMILKSGTSIGALIHEAVFAQSDSDYLNKLAVSLKEANETLYWLNLLRDTDYIHIDLYEKLAEIVKELIALLASCVKTLNNRLKSKNS